MRICILWSGNGRVCTWGILANNWKNILDKMTNVFRVEFKNTLPVYVGEINKKAGSQYLWLDPVGSELLEYNSSSETREFTVQIFYYFLEDNMRDGSLAHILRTAARIEALIHDNVSMTLSDSSNLFNCRMETTALDAEEDSEFYVVLWDFKAMHMGNVG